MKLLKQSVAFIALAVMFSSCTLYGKYKGSWENNESNDSVPAYTDIFTDPILQNYIEMALKQNYNLLIAHEHVAQAKAALTGAKLAYLPSLYAAPAINYTNASTTYGIAQASWQIELFGSLTNRKRQAAANHEQSKALEQAARVELIAAVAHTYYTLQMLNAQIAVADSATKNFQESVETLRQMKQAAMTDEAAVAQFEGSYYAVSATAKSLRLQYAITQNQFKLLLADTTSAFDFRLSTFDSDSKAFDFRLSTFDSDSKAFDFRLSTFDSYRTFDSIPLRWVRSRPDVLAAEHNLERAFYGVNLSRSNCCPQLTVTGTFGYGSGALYELVGGLLQPLFNSGKNIQEVRTAKSVHREAQLNYSNALLQAATEVSNSLAEQQIYSSQTEDYKQQVEALTRALDATKTKMHYGRGTYLEVLTAQNDLLSAELNLIQNQMHIIESQINLYQAIGGGK